MSIRKTKILIADDEPVGRQLLEAILLPEGYELIFSEDGEEAYNVTLKNHPDIILLDVMMPKMDGFQVCKKIRKTEETAHTPIFLITALDDRDSKIRGIDAGADDYISKPFDRIEILAKVKNSTNLISYRKQNNDIKKQEKTEIDKGSPDKKLFEGFCDFLLSFDPQDARINIHRSLPPCKSMNAFFQSESETGTYYFMVSNSLKNYEVLLTNILLKELLRLNSYNKQHTPSQILNSTLEGFHDFSIKYNIAAFNEIKTSVLIFFHDKVSDSFRASGINQTMYVGTKKKTDRNNIPISYNSYNLMVDQDVIIPHPKNVFLFSASIIETVKKQDLNFILDEFISSDMAVDLSNLAEKLNQSLDIIIVNLSF